MERVSKSSKDELSMKVSGNSLRVYWYLATNAGNSVGVRNVQRAMRFSSPSSAFYHLEKLRSLGLIDKNEWGNYFIKKPVKFHVMRNFIFVGNHFIPRHLIYATIITVISIVYFVLLTAFLSSLLVFVALLPNVISAVIFWYEAFIVWQSKPKFN